MEEPGSKKVTAGDLDSSSASLRFEVADRDALLHALVERLGAVPGLHLTLDYRRGWLRRLIGDLPYINDLHRRNGRIERVVVRVGTTDYWVRSEDGSITCGTDRMSIGRGRVTTPLTFPQWAQELLETLVFQNRAADASLSGLRDLLMDNQA